MIKFVWANEADAIVDKLADDFNIDSLSVVVGRNVKFSNNDISFRVPAVVRNSENKGFVLTYGKLIDSLRSRTIHVHLVATGIILVPTGEVCVDTYKISSSELLITVKAKIKDLT